MALQGKDGNRCQEGHRQGVVHASFTRALTDTPPRQSPPQHPAGGGGGQGGSRGGVRGGGGEAPPAADSGRDVLPGGEAQGACVQEAGPEGTGAALGDSGAGRKRGREVEDTPAGESEGGDGDGEVEDTDAGNMCAHTSLLLVQWPVGDPSRSSGSNFTPTASFILKRNSFPEGA